MGYSTVRQLSREAWPPADQVKLASLKKRQLVYCDITQSFSMAELENILRSANNVMPAAILLMQKHLDEGKSKKAKPPGYFKTKRSGSRSWIRSTPSCAIQCAGKGVPTTWLSFPPAGRTAGLWVEFQLRAMALKAPFLALCS